MAALGLVTPCVVVMFVAGMVLIGLIGVMGAGNVLLYAPALTPVSAIENQQPVVYQADVVVPLADIALVVQPEYVMVSWKSGPTATRLTVTTPVFAQPL